MVRYGCLYIRSGRGAEAAGQLSSQQLPRRRVRGHVRKRGTTSRICTTRVNKRQGISICKKNRKSAPIMCLPWLQKKTVSHVASLYLTFFFLLHLYNFKVLMNLVFAMKTPEN